MRTKKNLGSAVRTSTETRRMSRRLDGKEFADKRGLASTRRIEKALAVIKRQVNSIVNVGCLQ